MIRLNGICFTDGKSVYGKGTPDASLKGISMPGTTISNNRINLFTTFRKYLK